MRSISVLFIGEPECVSKNITVHIERIIIYNHFKAANEQAIHLLILKTMLNNKSKLE